MKPIAYICLAMFALLAAEEPAVAQSWQEKAGHTGQIRFEICRNASKAWYRETHLYRGHAYTIYKDVADRFAGIKENDVHKGIRYLVDRGISIPPGLAVYLLFSENARNANCLTEAFHRGEGFRPMAAIFLTTHEKKNLDSIASRMYQEGSPSVWVTTIHEISHILHERWAGDLFWSASAEGARIGIKFSAPADIAGQVSTYAEKGSKKEFVAEVFTGAVTGMRWPDAVWQAYRDYRGPMIPGISESSYMVDFQ